MLANRLRPDMCVAARFTVKLLRGKAALSAPHTVHYLFAMGLRGNLESVTRVELATPGLEGRCSTN